MTNRAGAREPLVNPYLLCHLFCYFTVAISLVMMIIGVVGRGGEMVPLNFLSLVFNALTFFFLSFTWDRAWSGVRARWGKGKKKGSALERARVSGEHPVFGSPERKQDRKWR